MKLEPEEQIKILIDHFKYFLIMNRFEDIKQSKTKKGKRYYRETFVPTIPEQEGDIYFITERGDRLDLIAYEFYKDVSLWWVLATANPISTRRDSYMVKTNQQFRIPINPQSIILEYNKLNNNR